MPLTTIRMDLRIIILNEVNQMKKDKLSYDIAYMWNLKEKKTRMDLFPKQKETHKHRKQNLWLSKGKVEWEAEIKRLGLTYTHYV